MLRLLLSALALLAAGLVLLAFVGPASAQCYSHGRTVGVRVAGHGYNYGHAIKVRQVKKVLAFNAHAAYTPAYFYGVSDAYSYNLLADAVAFRVQQALASQAAQYAQQAQAVAAGDCQACQQQPGQPGGIASGNQIQIVPQNAGWKAQLTVLVQKNCVGCHNGGKNKVDLTNLDAVPPAIRGACFYSAKCGDMPQGGQKLSAEQVELFRQWMKSK